MGTLAFILVLIVLAVVIYFLVYPWPAVNYLQSQYKRDFHRVSDLLNDNAELVTQIEYKEGHRKFTGSVYSFKHNDAVPRGDSVLVWMGNGNYVVSNVLGVPTAFQTLLGSGTQIIQFDYPEILAFTQTEAHKYIATVMQWLVDHHFESGARIYLGGENLGAFYALTFLNSQYSKDELWPDIDWKTTSVPTRVFAISPFTGHLASTYKKFIWNFYVQRGAHTKVTNDVLILNSKLQVDLFQGAKDPLYYETLEFAQLNKNVKLHLYDGKQLVLHNLNDIVPKIQDIIASDATPPTPPAPVTSTTTQSTNTTTTTTSYRPRMTVVPIESESDYEDEE